MWYFYCLIFMFTTSVSASSLRLDSWMNDLMPLINNLSLLDLSLPGTHDTQTYDLSTIVSNAAIGPGDEEVISWILHESQWIEHDELGPFIRNQSRTQFMTITEQLDAGIRFIDFRQMLSSNIDNRTSNEHSEDWDWYSLHFMQSYQLTYTYFQEIRTWLDAHPSEVIVMWLSRHGDENYVGHDQYPGVSVQAKQLYWSKICNIFNGLLMDFSSVHLNTTSINDLVKSNQRVAILASDYVEFTNSSQFALDAHIHLQNDLLAEVWNASCAYWVQRNTFAAAKAFRKQLKQQNKFYLTSLSGSATEDQLTSAASLSLNPGYHTAKMEARCAHSYNVPGMSNCTDCWCPLTLREVSQLSNFYTQLTMEMVVLNDDWVFPNAIYMDALDLKGNVRTGISNSLSSTVNATAGYAYVPTMLYSNVQNICRDSTTTECQNAATMLEAMRALAPVEQWSDSLHGRAINWPNENTICMNYTTTLKKK